MESVNVPLFHSVFCGVLGGPIANFKSIADLRCSAFDVCGSYWQQLISSRMRFLESIFVPVLESEVPILFIT